MTNREESPDPVSSTPTTPTIPPSPSTLSRRALLGTAVTTGVASVLASAPASAQSSAALSLSSAGGQKRRLRAYLMRVNVARENYHAPVPEHPDNGDEELYPDHRACYSKGLPHDAIGEVDPAAYDSLLAGLARRERLEDVVLGNPLGGGPPAGITPVHRLINPQAGIAFELQGPDSWALAIPPAPAFASAWEAGEIVENYWMAHLRDVPFARYVDHPLAQTALADLNALSDYRGPRSTGGTVTAQELFRDDLPGCAKGPYLSQVFWLPQPFGAQDIDPRVHTAPAGADYMTSQTEWVARQSGFNPGAGVPDAGLVYARDGRDLGQWVHVDVLFQAYFQALLALSAAGVPASPTNPYHGSATQVAFGTLGGPNFAALVCEVATRALKAVWFQKWYVHRRLRPEVFAGRIHVHLTGQKSYDVHADALGSAGVAEAFSRRGTYLLPMAFPEGSPAHPSYGAGHATVAGACVTILKALLDAERPVTDFFTPMIATDDGQGLVPYGGADVSEMTIAGELNKVASNVATGRNIAGVHWRTDGAASLRLGEAVAVGLLRDQKVTYPEPVTFAFTGFDGQPIVV